MILLAEDDEGARILIRDVLQFGQYTVLRLGMCSEQSRLAVKNRAGSSYWLRISHDPDGRPRSVGAGGRSALGFKVLFLSGYIDAVIRHSSPGAEAALPPKQWSPGIWQKSRLSQEHRRRPFATTPNPIVPRI